VIDSAGLCAVVHECVAWAAELVVEGDGCCEWRRFVRNAAVNATRGARTTYEIEERGHGTADQSVLAAVEQSERIAWLMEAVHELPARQRDALVGHAFEGRSYGEIAERQHTTVSAVKSLLTRARRTLSADASLSVIAIGTPLGAAARAFRALRARGLLAGKAGGAKGLAGAFTQAALAATVTTGVLMAVHGAGFGSAAAGQVRPPDAGAHHTVAQASASRPPGHPRRRHLRPGPRSR
jgi:hypothetical protein